MTACKRCHGDGFTECRCVTEEAERKPEAARGHCPTCGTSAEWISQRAALIHALNGEDAPARITSTAGVAPVVANAHPDETAEGANDVRSMREGSV